MASFIFLLIPFLMSCSHEPVRSIASTSRPTHRNIDVLNSTVRLVSGNKLLLQLKNNFHENLEISFTEVKLQNAEGVLVPFQLQRVDAGKYYVHPLIYQEELELSIQGKLIGKIFKLNLRKPDPQNSYFSILLKERYSLLMNLKLADKYDDPISSDEIPEIIIDGEAVVEGLRPLGEGNWEFILKYPEHDQIFYLSVRSHDTYLEQIFRFQHVEKSP